MGFCPLGAWPDPGHCPGDPLREPPGWRGDGITEQPALGDRAAACPPSRTPHPRRRPGLWGQCPRAVMSPWLLVAARRPAPGGRAPPGQLSTDANQGIQLSKQLPPAPRLSRWPCGPQGGGDSVGSSVGTGI